MRGQKDYNIQRVRRSVTKECLLYMTEEVKYLSTPRVETQKMLEKTEWIGREKEYVFNQIILLFENFVMHFMHMMCLHQIHFLLLQLIPYLLHHVSLPRSHAISFC